jgi:hypothetical protein
LSFLPRRRFTMVNHPPQDQVRRILRG